jgi:acyl dehydratase
MTVKEFPIEAGHILMFARAIGDENRVYADADYAKSTEAGGIVAPPTFARASAQFDPDHERPKPGQPWIGSGKNPTGVTRTEESTQGPRVLAAETHFEYHRHVTAGDVLTATRRPGGTWEREGRRSGKITFTEGILEFRDQNGDLAITVRVVSARTEHVVSQA